MGCVESWDLILVEASRPGNSGGGGVQNLHCLERLSLINAQASLTKTSKQTWGQTSARPAKRPAFVIHGLAWPWPAAFFCLFHRVTHTEDVVGQHHLARGTDLAGCTALHCSARRPDSQPNFCLVPCLGSDRPSPSSGGLGFQTGDSICVLPQARPPGPLAPVAPPELPSLITRHHHRQLPRVHGLLDCLLRMRITSNLLNPSIPAVFLRNPRPMRLHLP